MAPVSTSRPGRAVALIVALLLAAQNVNSQPRPIKVGMITVSSDQNDPSTIAESVSLINGANMAALDRGYKVNLVTSGLGCDTDNIVKEIERLVKVEKVVAIIGPMCSGTTLAAAPTINALKVPAITATAGALAVTTAGPYIYRTIATAQTYLNKLISFLATKYTSMAIVYDDTLLAADWVGLAETYFGQHGGSVTSKGQFSSENGTVPQMEDLVKKALASKPDFIFFMATSAIAPELEVAFIKAARAVDPKFPIAMPNGYDEAAKAGLQVTAANGSTSYPLVDGIYYVNDVIYPKANDRYKSMFGIAYMPTLDAGAQSNSYDAMSAIIRAAQAAGYSNLKNINKELSAKGFTFPRYGGNTGRFDVNGDIMADAQLQTYSPVTGEAVPLDVMP